MFLNLNVYVVKLLSVAFWSSCTVCVCVHKCSSHINVKCSPHKGLCIKETKPNLTTHIYAATKCSRPCETFTVLLRMQQNYSRRHSNIKTPSISLICVLRRTHTVWRCNSEHLCVAFFASLRMITDALFALWHCDTPIIPAGALSDIKRLNQKMHLSRENDFGH